MRIFLLNNGGSVLDFRKFLCASCGILSVFAYIPNSPAKDNISVDENILNFYQAFSEATLSGGSEMISFYENNYDKNVESIKTIYNIFPDEKEGDLKGSVVEKNWDGLQKEAKTFSEIIQYNIVDYKIQDVEFNDNKSTAYVKFSRSSSFIMTRYGIRNPFNVKEYSQCADELSLTGADIKIIKSDCTVKLYIDHKA